LACAGVTVADAVVGGTDVVGDEMPNEVGHWTTGSIVGVATGTVVVVVVVVVVVEVDVEVVGPGVGAAAAADADASGAVFVETTRATAYPPLATAATAATDTATLAALCTAA